MTRASKSMRVMSGSQRSRMSGPGWANATGHRGSKPGFAHRQGGTPGRPLLAETTEGVPPRAKLHRPLTGAVPMHNDARLNAYIRMNGSPALTPAQSKRARQKLARQTIRPQRQVTVRVRSAMPAGPMPAGPAVPQLASLTWSKKVTRKLEKATRPMGRLLHRKTP